MSVRRCSEVWERYRRSPYCHSSCCSSRTDPIRRGAPLRPPATATDADAEREVPGRLREIDSRSRFDPAAGHARADGARVLLVWAVRGDESVRGLLAGAGLERTPSRRELPVGRGVTEECWGAAL